MKLLHTLSGQFPKWIVGLVCLAGAGGLLAVRGGAMFSPGPLSAKTTAHPAGGVAAHAELSNNCAACHAPPWSRETLADRCLACHTDVKNQIDAGGPMHGKLARGNECRHCHTEHQGAHAAITRLDRFDHSATAFPLTGKHTAMECQACHAGDASKKLFPGEIRNVSQTCVACHREPDVHKGKFGLACAACHTTLTWRGATPSPENFDHSKTAFPLTGKHTTLTCRTCHLDNASMKLLHGAVPGSAQTCATCHREPDVHKGKFGVACAACHTTLTWRGAVPSSEHFDHSKTAFPLTGKHTTLTCKACHLEKASMKLLHGAVPGAQTCVACHREPDVHKGKFGVACAACHTTLTWRGATIQHKFPLDHGQRRGKQNPAAVAANSCVTCHATPGNYAVYTCYGCHAHTPERMVQRHRERKEIKSGKIPLERCATCHPKGREHARIADAAEVDECLFAAEIPAGIPTGIDADIWEMLARRPRAK